MVNETSGSRRRSVLKSIGATGASIAGIGATNVAATSTGETVQIVESTFEYDVTDVDQRRLDASGVQIDVPKQYWVESADSRVVFSKFAKEATVQTARRHSQVLGGREVTPGGKFDGHPTRPYLVTERTAGLRATAGVPVVGTYRPPQFEVQFDGETAVFHGAGRQAVPVGSEAIVDLTERSVPLRLRPTSDQSTASSTDGHDAAGSAVAEAGERVSVQASVRPRLRIRNHGKLDVAVSDDTLGREF